MRGSLRKRSEGSWQLLWSSRGPDGKRKQHSLTMQGTKREAERRLTEIIRSIDQGTYVAPNRRTVAEYLQYWLESIRGSVAATSYVRYARIVNGRLTSGLGGMWLHQVRPADIQAVYNGWVEGGLSPRTIRLHHAVLKRALGMAVGWELIPRNPAAFVETPTIRSARRDVLNDSELSALLKAAEGGAYYAAIALAVTTGMRRSEICGLRWADLDLEEGTLIVTQGVARLNGKLVLQPPKTQRGRRSISLPQVTVNALRDLPRTGELVFSNRKGGILDPDVISRVVRRLCDALGTPSTIHGLRHSHASFLMRENIHPRAVSERMGHSNIAFTLNVYSHTLPEQDRRAAEVVGRALSNIEKGLDPGHET